MLIRRGANEENVREVPVGNLTKACVGDIQKPISIYIVVSMPQITKSKQRFTCIVQRKLPNVLIQSHFGECSIASLKQRAPAAIGKLLYRSVPCKPNIKKWTKYGPALDFHLVAAGTNILPMQLKSAYKQISFRVSKFAPFDPETPDLVLDPQTQDVNWHYNHRK